MCPGEPMSDMEGAPGLVARRPSAALSFRQFVWLWNRLQGLSTPSLHLEIAGWLERGWIDGDERLLLLVFRDAGKSTLVGLFCAWLLVSDPNLRLLVVAAEHSLAGKMARNVKRILERHPLSRAIVPGRGQLWASDQFTVIRPRELRDPSLLARGIGGNVTGARADVIICDDVEVPNTVDTAGKREDLRQRLLELSFVLVPGGLQLYIGTPHSFESIYASEDQLPAGQLPFLAGINRLVLPLLDEAGESRWPERFPPDTIESLKREVGPARFRSQMLLEPVDLRDIRLDPERLKPFEAEIEITYANRERIVTLEERRMVAVNCWWDPAFGSPSGGDSSVLATVFVDADGGFWVMDVSYLTHDPASATEMDEGSQLCRQVAEIARHLAVPTITLETNGIGRFLPNLLRRHLAASRAGISVREHVSTGNKDRRIVEAFDPVLAAGSLHVHQRVWNTPFLDEMRNFQPGGRNRDDGLDAVAGCLVTSPVGLSRLGNPAQSGPGRAAPAVARTDFQL